MTFPSVRHATPAEEAAVTADPTNLELEQASRRRAAPAAKGHEDGGGHRRGKGERRWGACTPTLSLSPTNFARYTKKQNARQ